jgi:hypothetical protein
MESKRFVGKWWLPSTPEQKVGGVLKINAKSRLRLELTDALVPQTSSGDPAPLIYGAAKGRYITLLETYPDNGGGTTTAQTRTTTQVFRPRIALVGIMLNDPSEEAFHGIETSMTGLTAWASSSGLRDSFVGGPDPDERIRMTARWTDPIETEIEDTSETLGLHWHLSFNGPRVTASERRYTATERVVLQVHAKSPRAWDGFLDRSREVKDLITVATQQPSRVFEHKLLINRENPPIPYTVELHYHGIDRSAEEDENDVEPAFTIEDIDFATVIRDWLELRKDIDLPLDVLLGLDYQRGGYYENRLFNVAAAAEGFHTALFPDSTGLPPDAHAAVVRRAENALYYALKDDREWAMSRIKDNRPGLKDRLLELTTVPDGEAVNDLLTDVDTWAKWLKNARNAIGHLNPGELERKVPLEDARYRLEYVTRAFLHLVILAKLGVSDEVQRQLVFENWRYSAERFRDAIRESQSATTT